MPSGENASATTSFPEPLKRNNSLPVPMSQMTTAWPCKPQASTLPLAGKATDSSWQSGPGAEGSRRPLRTSQAWGATPPA